MYCNENYRASEVPQKKKAQEFPSAYHGNKDSYCNGDIFLLYYNEDGFS